MTVQQQQTLNFKSILRIACVRLLVVVHSTGKVDVSSRNSPKPSRMTSGPPRGMAMSLQRSSQVSVVVSGYQKAGSALCHTRHVL